MTADRIMAWAIPAFFLLIAVELMVAKLRGRDVYYGNDAINSIGLGVISQIAGVFTKLLSIGIYAWFVQHVSIWKLPADSAWVWVSGLLLYDFLYYWLHREGHEVNVLWAAHVVHHQSESYNLTTALRQTSTGSFLGWVFYLPMALIGYPVEVFVVVALIDLLYQFWVHTEMVGKLGWFDRVFCSPSNHRAHHAVNDRYLDHNYGGILIIWDRMFGTFIEESDEDPPVYGTRAPLQSWNPLWANVEVYWAIAKDAWHARNGLDKLRVWFKPPGWRPADVAARFPKPEFDITHARFNPPISRALSLYGLAQFVLLLFMGMHFLGAVPHMDTGQAIAYGAYLTISLCIIGLLLEGRHHVMWPELVRLSATAIVPAALGRWFGVVSLDTRVAMAFFAMFGVSAVMLLWVVRREQATVQAAQQVVS